MTIFAEESGFPFSEIQHAFVLKHRQCTAAVGTFDDLKNAFQFHDFRFFYDLKSLELPYIR